WPRITVLGAIEAEPLQGVDSGAVSDVEIEDHRISFTTTAVGVPHLVKVSYFPNWVAEGALGPYHAAPSLMVVVPEQEQVVIEFRNQAPEWLGIFLTVVGTAGLVTALVSLRRRESGGSPTVRAVSAEPV